MGRRNGNARPRDEVAPVPLEAITDQELGPVTPPVERDHGFRSAAKHAPSRVSSRMYAQVRTATASLAEAELRLARASLPADVARSLAAQIAEYRARLSVVRDQIPAASRSRSKADDVKTELGTLVSLTRLTAPAVSALAHHAKTQRPVKSKTLSAEERTRQDAAAAAAHSVLESMQVGRPGVIGSALARLRGLGAVPAAA